MCEAADRGPGRDSAISSEVFAGVRAAPESSDERDVRGIELLFPPSERGLSAPVPSNLYENWAGVDIMHQSDRRRRRQSLVYFGEPQDLVS